MITPASPNGRANRKAIVAERRRDVMDLYRQAYQQQEIAEMLGVSPTVISRDIKAIREGWIEEAKKTRGEIAMQELAKLDADEAAVRRELGTLRKEHEKDRKRKLILAIMERRAKMLGLDRPEELNVNINWRDALREAGIDVTALFESTVRNMQQEMVVEHIE